MDVLLHQPRPRVSRLPVPWNGKMRDPGNEVSFTLALSELNSLCRVSAFVLFSVILYYYVCKNIYSTIYCCKSDDFNPAISVNSLHRLFRIIVSMFTFINEITYLQTNRTRIMTSVVRTYVTIFYGPRHTNFTHLTMEMIFLICPLIKIKEQLRLVYLYFSLLFQ